MKRFQLLIAVLSPIPTAWSSLIEANLKSRQSTDVVVGSSNTSLACNLLQIAFSSQLYLPGSFGYNYENTRKFRDDIQ